MLIIGFATEFYTLWDLHETKNYFVHEASGQSYHTSTIKRYTYLKNISKDINFVQQEYPNTPIDISLKGTRRIFREEKIDFPAHIFNCGYKRGCEIAIEKDIDCLIWAAERTYSNERYENIKKRLAELGYYHHPETHSFKTQDEINVYNEKERKLKEFLEQREKFLDENKDGGSMLIDCESNLTSGGSFKKFYLDFRIQFKDYNVLYYNGFEYGLPTINGKGKKIKGKTIKIYFNIQKDKYGEFEIFVNSFEIMK